MDPKAVEKAKARLALARKRLEAANKCTTLPEFKDEWYSFLVAAKNVYTALEQGSKTTPQSRQWFGAKKRERKDDPLLQYLYQARDDDEHGIQDVIELDAGHTIIGKAAPGFSNNMRIDRLVIDDHGRPSGHITSLDGLPVLIEDVPPAPRLAPVTGRGNVVYQPPNQHLGIPLANLKPYPVGRAALDYLKTLVEDAESRAS